MSIGSRIREARERAGLNQVELAKMIGITKGSIGNYESGVSSPKDEILFKLISALNVDANYIFQDCVAPKQNDELTESELTLIRAYRSHPDQQAAVKKLLDVENGGDLFDGFVHRLRSPQNQNVLKR